MTAPRAVGVRAPYSSMPEVVRAWVDATLGSPVVEAVDQVGGMSPGCATRLRCADGTRALVKAVGADLNPDTPTLFRREITALTLLGSHPLWADLLASYATASGWPSCSRTSTAGTPTSPTMPRWNGWWPRPTSSASSFAAASTSPTCNTSSAAC